MHQIRSKLLGYDIGQVPPFHLRNHHRSVFKHREGVLPAAVGCADAVSEQYLLAVVLRKVVTPECGFVVV